MTSQHEIALSCQNLLSQNLPGRNLLNLFYARTHELNSENGLEITPIVCRQFFYNIASCIFKMFVFGSQNVHNHNFFKKVVQSEFFSYKERYPISFTNCLLEKDLVRVASGPMRNHPSTWILLWKVDYKMSAIWSHQKRTNPGMSPSMPTVVWILFWKYWRI